MLPNGLTLAFLLQILSVVQVIIVGPYLAILLFLFLIPLGMYSPCIREVGTLGPKPALIGHRGAPMVGVEKLLNISSSSVLLPLSSSFIFFFFLFFFPLRNQWRVEGEVFQFGIACQRDHSMVLLTWTALLLRDKDGFGSQRNKRLYQENGGTLIEN